MQETAQKRTYKADVWFMYAAGCVGSWAQQIEHDDADLLQLDELTLSSTEPCSLPEYGLFGKYDVASSLGYGAAAPGGYGGYAGAAAVGQYGSANPGQYAAAAGAYGAAAAPGGYGGTTAAAELLQDSHCKPLVMPGRLLSVGGLANCKVRTPWNNHLGARVAHGLGLEPLGCTWLFKC
jgi:hypothetical protein